MRRSLHGALAACGALAATVVVWAAAWLIFWIANTHANEWFERVGWLDVAFGTALICAFAGVLAARGVPGWALVVAGGALAVPVFGPVGLLVPALVGALAVTAVAVALAGRAAARPRVAVALGAAAAFLILVPAFALTGFGAPIEPKPRFTLAPKGGAAQPKAKPRRQRARPRRERPDRPKAAAPAPSARPVLARPPAAPAPAPAARPPAPAVAARPVPPAAPASPATAERFLRAYYAELRREDFAAAWARLAPAVRSAFGGFEPWRDGFATTVSQRLTQVRGTAAGATATVTLTLHAADAACGTTIRQRFAQAWTLTRDGARWRATGVRAEKVAGPSPCAA